jgi:hypothetical protein
MDIPKELTTVTPLSKTLAIIFFVTLPFIGFFLGMRYQALVDISKTETIILPNPSPKIEPTITEPYCARAGERSVSNFDLRTGKTNPNIEVKNCCSGLKNIAEKQSGINKNSDICAQSSGISYNLCSPCGNGVCDSQYEDHCNCPQDCK